MSLYTQAAQLKDTCEDYIYYDHIYWDSRYSGTNRIHWLHKWLEKTKNNVWHDPFDSLQDFLDLYTTKPWYSRLWLRLTQPISELKRLNAAYQVYLQLYSFTNTGKLCKDLVAFQEAINAFGAHTKIGQSSRLVKNCLIDEIKQQEETKIARQKRHKIIEIEAELYGLPANAPSRLKRSLSLSYLSRGLNFFKTNKLDNEPVAEVRERHCKL